MTAIVLAQTITLDMPRVMFTAGVGLAATIVIGLASRAVKSIDDKVSDLGKSNDAMYKDLVSLELKMLNEMKETRHSVTKDLATKIGQTDACVQSLEIEVAKLTERSSMSDRLDAGFDRIVQAMHKGKGV